MRLHCLVMNAFCFRCVWTWDKGHNSNLGKFDFIPNFYHSHIPRKLKTIYLPTTITVLNACKILHYKNCDSYLLHRSRAREYLINLSSNIIRIILTNANFCRCRAKKIAYKRVFR